jgi:hypothetical protein
LKLYYKELVALNQSRNKEIALKNGKTHLEVVENAKLKDLDKK